MFSVVLQLLCSNSNVEVHPIMEVINDLTLSLSKELEQLYHKFAIERIEHCVAKLEQKTTAEVQLNISFLMEL